MRYCFYDDYRRYLDDVIETFASPTAQIRRGEVPPNLLLLQRQLRQTNPYILTGPVMSLVLEMTEKAAMTPVPFVPFPKLPFWAEFDKYAFGSEHDQFHAIFALEDFERPSRIRLQFITLDFQVKQLFFDKLTGAWEYQQVGTCAGNGICPLAPKTIEGEYYAVGENNAGMLIVEECNCAKAGFYLNQTIRLLNHVLLQQHPIVQAEQDRTIPLPHKNATSARKKSENSRAQAHNKRYPRYVEVSLSAPVAVSQSAPRSRQELASSKSEDYLAIEQDQEKIAVQSHWKVLVPGEGKPWKGMHLIHVDSYARKQKPSDSRTRYIITE